jgi:type II secretory pathway component PulJ
MTFHQRPNPRTRARTRAFTLIEVMLALAILMMVLAVIYSTWIAILRAKRAADQAAINAQRARIAVRALEDTLEGVQSFQANQPLYAFIADTSTEFAFLSVASRLPVSFPGSGLFGDQTLRRVNFEVEPGTNNRPQLVMRQYPLLLATNAFEEAYPVVLAQDLTDFQLEFWDARTGQWEPEWTYTNQLPTVLRFLLGIGRYENDPNRPQNVQVHTVSLNAKLVPNDLQGRGPRPTGPQGTNPPPQDPNPNPNPPADPGNP